MNVIQVEHLTKFYGQARGILDLSFDVHEGEVFGFIGPNGAGKSTTIRLLLSLIYPTSGSATIFGRDCIAHGAELRQDIGYLPSEVFYYEGMRVGDLLHYAASFYRRDCRQRLRELSELMELDLSRRVDDLSYGNRKKVGIVQGLLHSPRLIILDEPTAGLDPLMQRTFFDLIRQENQRGATVFFSSHILSEVQRLCSRVAIIKEGRLIDLQDIRTLQRDNYKKIHLVAPGVDPERLQVEGVTGLQAGADGLTLNFRGDINRLTGLIASLPVSDLTIEDLSLEEIFMHYYQ
ncbi:MAG: ABC transporter ATP-binding protein [Anaerolineae bacterium]|jgi:ABC-2 type transport system ATP-binding protein|nr:ABC transporter ATP-binding protein [Chloroflexota bacterium]